MFHDYPKVPFNVGTCWNCWNPLDWFGIGFWPAKHCWSQDRSLSPENRAAKSLERWWFSMRLIDNCWPAVSHISGLLLDDEPQLLPQLHVYMQIRIVQIFSLNVYIDAKNEGFPEMVGYPKSSLGDPQFHESTCNTKGLHVRNSSNSQEMRRSPVASQP